MRVPKQTPQIDLLYPPYPTRQSAPIRLAFALFMCSLTCSLAKVTELYPPPTLPRTSNPTAKHPPTCSALALHLCSLTSSLRTRSRASNDRSLHDSWKGGGGANQKINKLSKGTQQRTQTTHKQSIPNSLKRGGACCTSHPTPRATGCK